MPRRKRFRNRRGRKKKIQIKNNDERTELQSVDLARPGPETPSRDCLSTSFTDILTTPKPTETPSPRSELGDTLLNNQILPDVPLITETPINRRKSWNRERKSNYGSMNITNLNVLFESNFINNSPKSECNISIGGLPSFHRSKSSIAKLHSPGKERPLSVNQSTQTVDTELCIKQTNSITETPKFSAVFLQENVYTHKSFPFLKNQDSFNKKEICPERLNRFYEKGVNINPYLKTKEIDGKNKNGSFGEISFFSPNLFQHKTSSTPIEKILNKAIDIDEQVALCDLNVSKLELPSSFIDNSFGTPKLNANLNVNDGISPDKVSLNCICIFNNSLFYMRNYIFLYK